MELGIAALGDVLAELLDRLVKPRDKVREALLKLELRTMFGDYKVDQDGYQLAHKMVTFQWQKEKKVVVWPDELAQGKVLFPTPPWSSR